MKAYLTADPRDGKRRPAVLWAKGGFGGIGPFWGRPDPKNDQTAAAFREAGFVVMYPSWRGENDNPGRLELFYGEVDDLLAARDALARQTYVDPDRIYLAGHSTGGTLTLLAATATDKFRAAFSFGGAPDLHRVLAGGGYGNTPFDARDEKEAYYRSATHFVKAIRRPTFYFEGCSDGYEAGYCPDAVAMQGKAEAAGVPFKAYCLPWGDHFTVLHKTTRLVAKKIAADTGPACNVAFTKEELGAR
jgi:dipeptidyl aminopeptidase/acylaminoacyl peptidase